MKLAHGARYRVLLGETPTPADVFAGAAGSPLTLENCRLAQRRRRQPSRTRRAAARRATCSPPSAVRKATMPKAAESRPLRLPVAVAARLHSCFRFTFAL